MSDSKFYIIFTLLAVTAIALLNIMRMLKGIIDHLGILF